MREDGVTARAASLDRLREGYPGPPCASTSSRRSRMPSAGSPSRGPSQRSSARSSSSGQVDDDPYGGGAGMVLRVDVVDAALEAAYGADRPGRIVALTPQGRLLDQALVEELAQESELALLSSRFEGFDERIVGHLATDAVSIGPYVLSGGELPAMVTLDAIARRLPGALAEGSGEHESFSAELD